MAIEIALWGPERHAEFTRPLLTAFGLPFDSERAARAARLTEIIQRIAAVDGDRIVGSAGGYRLEMTVPGGTAKVCGLTMVGVMPTHRRRGILTSMVRRHFEEAQGQGLPVSALWASEGQIYGRFGYGMASVCASLSIERERSQFHRAMPQPGTFRLVDDVEARDVFPAVWEQVRPVTPGMLTRSSLWWEYRRLMDYEKASPPLHRVLLEVDGRPEGYAIYRFTAKVAPPGLIQTNLAVTEAVAVSPRATSQLWRYLLDMDLVSRVEVTLVPPSHPIMHLVQEPRRLHMALEDALWMRLIDADAALQMRSYPAHESLTFALHDAFCPWNSGVYRIADGRVKRAHASPDLKLDASALGSLYLGGITARHLADAGAIDELVPGAIDRADTLFRSARAPWCPEIF